MKKVSKLFLMQAVLFGFAVAGWTQTANQQLIEAVTTSKYKKVVNAVEQQHADVNTTYRDFGLNTPVLQLAAIPPYTSAKIFTYLARRPGIDLNKTSSMGDTALMAASEFLSKKELEVLFEKKNRKGRPVVKVNAKSQANWTAFLAAAQGGKVENAEFLKSKGADIYARDSFNNTALIIASNAGKLEMAQYLVYIGLDYKSTNDMGQTAYDVARDPKVKGFLRRVKSSERQVRAELKKQFAN